MTTANYYSTARAAVDVIGTLTDRLNAAAAELSLLSEYIENELVCASHRRSALRGYVDRIRSALVGGKEGVSQ